MARYRAAWESADSDALFACYHPGFTIHYFGHNPFSGVHVGREACLKMLGEIGRRTGRKLIEVTDVVVGPQRAVVLARERFVRDQRRAELERAWVYTFEGGALRECWVYDADQATVDSFLAD